MLNTGFISGNWNRRLDNFLKEAGLVWRGKTGLMKTCKHLSQSNRGTELRYCCMLLHTLKIYQKSLWIKLYSWSSELRTETAPLTKQLQQTAALKIWATSAECRNENFNRKLLQDLRRSTLRPVESQEGGPGLPSLRYQTLWIPLG